MAIADQQGRGRERCQLAVAVPGGSTYRAREESVVSAIDSVRHQALQLGAPERAILASDLLVSLEAEETLEDVD